MSVVLSARLRALLARREPAMLLRVAEAKGSTPRGVDAAMLVAERETLGTIGGGELEFHAVDVARDLMAAGKASHRLAIALGAHLGQCCGGHVTLDFRAGTEAVADELARDEARQVEAFPTVLIFGAGHTGRALALALAPLPFAVTLVDDRAETLNGLQQNIATLRLDDPAQAIGAAQPGAAFVILTHSHALDYRLAQAALLRRDARYVGMIGSATKRARFERWFLASGGTRDDIARFTCPIGAMASVPPPHKGEGDANGREFERRQHIEYANKSPEVIAALTAAELLAFCRTRAPAPAAMREAAPA